MIAAAVALVPRLDCRYQSLSQRSGNRFASDNCSRYCIVLSAIVALTSTPTRPKPPQAADLVPHFSTATYELLRIPPQIAGSVLGHPNEAAPACAPKTMEPVLHSVLRVPDLHAVPVPARIAEPTPPRAAARRFIKRTSLSLNNPHASTRHPRVGRCRHPLPWRDRHHTCALSLFAYARCSCKLEGCRVSALFHGSPGKALRLL